jgi:hypothetical protein
MKEVFFDEDGGLSINQTIMSQPSYLKIMNDGVVTEEELAQQSELVMSIFRKIEDTFNEEQKALVQSLLVETNVLNTIYKYYEMDESLED